MFSIIRFTALILAVVFVSACSGGGGGTTTPPTSSPPTNPFTPAPTVPVLPEAPALPPGEPFVTDEYMAHGGLDMINVLPAYQAGLSGAGQVIGITDVGFDIQHPDLNDNIHPDSINIGNPGGPMEIFDGHWTQHGHGNIVSGTVVAERNGVGMHGVAFNAQVLAMRVDVDDGDPSQLSVPKEVVRDAIHYAIDRGVKIFSTSTLVLTTPMGETVWSAMRESIKQGAIWVIAAGNRGASEPWNFNQVALEPGMAGNVIIAGAVNESGEIHPNSDRAGTSAPIYLMAQGSGLGQLNNEDGIWYPTSFQGTSIAAPQIAGAIAILWEAFPNLTSGEIFDILTSTAKDKGEPGVDAITGHGLIDIGAALQPIGAQQIAISANGMTKFVPLETTALITSQAFGDAFASSALSQAMIVDKYNRSFVTNITNQPSSGINGTVASHIFGQQGRINTGLALSAGDNLGISYYNGNRRLAELADALPMYMQSTMQIERPALRYNTTLGPKLQAVASFGLPATSQIAGDTDNLPMLLGRGVPGQRTLINSEKQTSFGLVFAPDYNTQLGFSVGHGQITSEHPYLRRADQDQAAISSIILAGSKYIGPLKLSIEAQVHMEDGALLGSLSSRAASLGDGATSLFATASLQYKHASGFGIIAGYGRGTTNPKGVSIGLITAVDRFTTSKFHIVLDKTSLFREADRLAISFSQPLRVATGRASLRVATDRDYAANRFVFSDIDIPLVPSGRELNLDLAYQWLLGRDTSLQFNTLVQRHGGHVRSTPISFAGVLSLRTRF